MTTNDLLTTTLMLMGEDASAASGLQAAFMSVLNLLLAELFEAENSIRAATGQAELVEIPTVSLITDTVPYDARICRCVLPFGAAGGLLCEDNPALSAQYKNKYEYEKANAYKAAYADLADLTREEG